MTFDINEVLANMLEAIKGSVKQDWNIVKSATSKFIQSRKERLSLLADMRLHNQISQPFFEARLADEQKIIESELHAMAIISKVVAQNAANAAIEVLSKAVSIAVKAL